MLIQALLNGVTGTLILILIASGRCLVSGIMHLVNFAHGAFFMLGGFWAWLLFVRYPLPFVESEYLRFVLAVILSMVLVAFFGMIVEKLILRSWHVLHGILEE